MIFKYEIVGRLEPNGIAVCPKLAQLKPNGIAVCPELAQQMELRFVLSSVNSSQMDCGLS